MALVVAETHEQAVDAAELVAVDYEPLPAVAATADARRAGRAGGVGRGARQRRVRLGGRPARGRSTRAFASAAHVTRARLRRHPRGGRAARAARAPSASTTAAPAATRCTPASRRPHGTAHAARRAILQVPQSHVRVVTGEVGGSFGMRSGIYPEMVLVLWAAQAARAGR